MTLREKIESLIQKSDLEFEGALSQDTSLIKSGLLDSLALFNLAVLIEQEVGSKIDLNSFDLSRDWETIAEIDKFVAKHRIAK